MSERTEETERLTRLALVGHDIRSAMSDVVGGLELVETSGLDPDSRLQLERARAAGETLARLVDDAIAALTDGQTPARAGRGGRASDTVVLSDLVRDLERRWGGHAAANGLVLRIDLAPDVPLATSIASGPIERLLSNLLDNAVKYAERGAIVLSIDLDAEGALRFAVQDEGPGFSDTSLARLFGLGGRPPDSPQPGTGMGLHIAKSLADQMGGRIEAGNRRSTTDRKSPRVTAADRRSPDGYSPDGHAPDRHAPDAYSADAYSPDGPPPDADTASGACVAFVLPAGRWHPDGRGSGADAPTLPELTGRHVLVADDSGVNQAVLARMLGRLGARVDTVDDGEAALHALRRGGYDLAILDIHMPHRSGLEVIAETRRLPGPCGRVPILAATAYVVQGQRDAIYAAGADGLIAKPVVSLAALGEAISRLGHETRTWLPSHPAAEAAPHLGPDETGIAQETPVAPRLCHLLALAGPDEAGELIDRLSADLERSADTLAEAADRGDSCGVRAATHVLISLTGAVGAGRLQREMEAANAAAHRDDWTDIRTRVDAVAAPLAALRREVAAARGASAAKTASSAPKGAPAP
ncbi:response regulator [Rhodovulum sp. 12E13]|uniref:hybrid sensor histidine kinase/response regulator n=1 Tax=Rhodovulum sp. 12E13 TaxID=2203891 RepID=UPI000E154D3C|nr:hybrid sensor histidine kinase/response regulator [Rhodovulum sp. 12E13]RDC69023.1 response regulator [Rhodovulum sp. 12E13]